MKQYLLFDLDGTLTDPKEGITACVQYALKDFGIEEPDRDRLEPFIGPPLKDSFMEFYQMSEEQAERAVEKYRERFQDTGIFENKLYEGIPQMLRTLQSKGIFLAVASSKPEVFVERILEHFDIRKYFKAVVGSELDGSRVKKDEVVQEALNRLFGENPVDRKQVYMIGDRRFDVEGARALGIESVGVSYGYGSMEELKQAKADYIVRSVEELEKFLLRGADEKQTPKQAKAVMRQRMWTMLYSFLLFIMIRNVAMYALTIIFQYLGATLSGAVGDFIVVRNAAGEPESFTGNISTIMAALSFLAGAAAIRPTANKLLGMNREDMRLSHLKKEPVRNYVFLALATAGCVLGLNLVFDLGGFINKSEAYQRVAADQYSGSLLIVLVCYGVLTPLAEELMFRGILFGYMRRFLQIKTAIVLSSALFGFYHMNAVQGVYGFLIGCLMAYAYEYFGSFWTAVCVHIAANILGTLLTCTPVASTPFMSWLVCILLLAVGLGSLWSLAKQKNVL